VLQGEYIDSIIALNGANSIVGRSLVFHQSDGVRVAQCVIGSTRYGTLSPLPTSPLIFSHAGCRLSPVFLNLNNPSLTGYLFMESATPTTSTRFTYEISGLTANMNHTWHVHTLGSIVSSDDAMSATGHFKGSCLGNDLCRPLCPAGAKDEIGQIGSCQYPISTDADGHATGSIVDNLIPINGADGIIGRTIMIHNSTGHRVHNVLLEPLT